jgi:hypothetical protein
VLAQIANKQVVRAEQVARAMLHQVLAPARKVSNGARLLGTHVGRGQAIHPHQVGQVLAVGEVIGLANGGQSVPG